MLPALTAAAVLALAVPASAHVTVSADDASQGADDSVLAFRVPNEMNDASTVTVEFTFPTTGTPLASVSPAPKPGWTITTKTTKFATPITTDDGTISEGVSDVTYTAAAGGGTPVGQFDVFDILVGPLPTTVDSLQFPTLQTYSNRQVVSWIQPRITGQKDPDNPAPLLALTAAADGTDGTDGATPSAAPSVVAAPSTSSSSSGVADTALVLAIVGVLLGLGGVGFGIALAPPGLTAGQTDSTGVSRRSS